MDEESLKNLLEEIQAGRATVNQALEAIKSLASESLNGFATLDHQRALRTGAPEVIFAEGKTPDQVAEIFTHLAARSHRCMATRVSPEMYGQIKDRLPPETKYHPPARVLSLDKNPARRKEKGILILAAGTADIPVAEEAALTAELMGNEVEKRYDVGVAGLHRLATHLPALQKARVVIAAAGMEGALPSVVGGLISAPVIALPTSVGYGASFQGLAALLAMLNSCASGVAVVNIDNGFGAGCLAAKINRLQQAGEEDCA